VASSALAFHDIVRFPFEGQYQLPALSTPHLSCSLNQNPDQRNQRRNREKKGQEEEYGLVGLKHVDQRETTG